MASCTLFAGAAACSLLGAHHRLRSPRCGTRHVCLCQEQVGGSQSSSSSPLGVGAVGLGSLPKLGVDVSFRRENTIFKSKHKFADEYLIERRGAIGEGGYGKVFEARHRITDIKRAIKEIPKAGTGALAFTEEVEALASLDHPHIVKVVEYFEDDFNYLIVQELCTGPDLLDYMLDVVGGPVSTRAASIIMRQCIKSVICCHASGYIHRDLKYDNFMLSGDDNTVKLIDFGLATRFKSTEQLTKVAGTLGFMAPEMLVERKYNKNVDIWSLGVLFFALLTGEQLLPADDFQKRIALADPNYVAWKLSVSIPLAEAKLPPSGHDLLTRMLARDPAKRITAGMALSHPFILANWEEGLGTPERPLPLEWPFDRDVVHRLRAFAQAPRLKKIALLAMTHLASAQKHTLELLTAQHTFRTMDKDGDGHISFADLVEGLTLHNIEVPPDLSHVFSVCDSDSSKAMTYLEFVACCLPESCLEEALCTAAFHLLDHESSGRITPHDLQMLSQSCKYDAHEYEEIIHEFDINSRGYLDLEDFHRMMLGSDAVRPQSS